MSQVFFNYHLPAELIAQEPKLERDQSRLLVLRRNEKTISHHSFADLPNLLIPGDLLILNDTRVLPARLVGRRGKTGGKWEGLFLRELPSGEWELMGRTRGNLSPGETIEIEPGPLFARLVQKTEEGHWIVRPEKPGSA